LSQPRRVRHVVLLNTYDGRAPALRLPEMIRLFADHHVTPLADAMMADTDQRLWLLAYTARHRISPEGTTAQYRRDGVVFRPLRDAPPIAVQMIWRRHDPHPSTHAAVAMLTELYCRPS
jgi:hypothetical protein